MWPESWRLAPAISRARASALASAGYDEHDNAHAHVLGGLLFVTDERPTCVEAGGWDCARVDPGRRAHGPGGRHRAGLVSAADQLLVPAVRGRVDLYRLWRTTDLDLTGRGPAIRPLTPCAGPVRGHYWRSTRIGASGQNTQWNRRYRPLRPTTTPVGSGRSR